MRAIKSSMTSYHGQKFQGQLALWCWMVLCKQFSNNKPTKKNKLTTITQHLRQEFQLCRGWNQNPVPDCHQWLPMCRCLGQQQSCSDVVAQNSWPLLSYVSKVDIGLYALVPSHARFPKSSLRCCHGLHGGVCWEGKPYPWVPEEWISRMWNRCQLFRWWLPQPFEFHWTTFGFGCSIHSQVRCMPVDCNPLQ